MVAIETAEEMLRAVIARFADATIVIKAAAVADFRPKAVADRKLKKGDGPPELVLEPTPDILSGLAGRRPPGAVMTPSARSCSNRQTSFGCQNLSSR